MDRFARKPGHDGSDRSPFAAVDRTGFVTPLAFRIQPARVGVADVSTAQHSLRAGRPQEAGERAGEPSLWLRFDARRIPSRGVVLERLDEVVEPPEARIRRSYLPLVAACSARTFRREPDGTSPECKRCNNSLLQVRASRPADRPLGIEVRSMARRKIRRSGLDRERARRRELDRSRAEAQLFRPAGRKELSPFRR